MLIVLLNCKKAFCTEATVRAGVGCAPLGMRAMFFSPAAASGTVVAHKAPERGDRDGFSFMAAGEASVFEDLFEGDPDAKGFSYVVPIVVW